MFFKELDKDLLRDPGPDLQKVIKFQEGLINGKEILYETFMIVRILREKYAGGSRIM